MAQTPMRTASSISTAMVSFDNSDRIEFPPEARITTGLVSVHALGPAILTYFVLRTNEPWGQLRTDFFGFFKETLDLMRKKGDQSRSKSSPVKKRSSRKKDSSREPSECISDWQKDRQSKDSPSPLKNHKSTKPGDVARQGKKSRRNK